MMTKTLLASVVRVCLKKKANLCFVIIIQLQTKCFFFLESLIDSD